MSTQVILLEKVESLGQLGDVVSVRPGYARNYLLPQNKALRATKHNIAFFEAQKKNIVIENENKKKEAEKLVKKVDGAKVPLIRQASEGGQLYGSVSTRDIADAITAVTAVAVDRAMVQINRSFKMIGLFPVEIALHPEVTCTITINIARTPEEAQIQAETGVALVAGGNDRKDVDFDDNTDQLEGVLDDSAMAAEKEKKAKKAEDDAEKAE